MHPLLEQLHKSTPLTDKILAAVGIVTTGTISLGHVQTGIGILVGALTSLVLIPRVILAWRDLARRLRNAAAREEEEEGE